MVQLSNVNIYYSQPTATGRKVPIDQYAMTTRIHGTPATGVGNPHQSDHPLTWPECLTLLPEEKRMQLITDTLVQVSRLQAEAQAEAKEG